jgi:hypothetical protein
VKKSTFREIMDKLYLRHLFELNRETLNKLYLGKNTQKVLMGATDNCLEALIKILHLIASGKITLRRKDHEQIKKSRRENKLLAFESSSYFLNQLHDTRENKLKVLKQFVKVYPFILHLFFNRT